MRHNNIRISPSAWINDPMNYPFPEPPSVVSLPPGRAMGTSHSIMSASDMKTPSWSAPVDAQRPPTTSTTVEKATRPPHSHGVTGRWMRFCAPSQEQGISMDGCRGLTFTARYVRHTDLKPTNPKKKKKSPLPLPFHLLLPLLPLNGYIVLVIQPKSFSASSCEGVFASV